MKSSSSTVNTQKLQDTVTDIAVMKNDIGYIKEGIDDIKRSLAKGDERMDCQDKEIDLLKTTVNHPTTGLDATRNKVEEINLKAAALGAAAGVLGFFGLNNIGWLQSILGGK